MLVAHALAPLTLQGWSYSHTGHAEPWQQHLTHLGESQSLPQIAELRASQIPTGVETTSQDASNYFSRAACQHERQLVGRHMKARLRC